VTDTCSAVSTTGASEGGGPWFRPGIPPPNRNSLSILACYSSSTLCKYFERHCTITARSHWK